MNETVPAVPGALGAEVLATETEDDAAESTTLVGSVRTFLRVEGREPVADRVVRLTLVDPDGSPLPGWEPGAHVDLVLPGGLVRSYSLCSDPAATDRYEIAVLAEEESSGGSRYLHDPSILGTTLGYLGPRNHFELVEAPQYLFLAGGIGITPLRPMIAELEAKGLPWHLIYAGRSRASMAFLDELFALAPERVEPVVADEGGRLDVAQRFAALERGTVVYCCGPTRMIAAAESASWRIGTRQLHLERFRPLPIPPRMLGEGEVEFDVRLARAGAVVHVPKDRSILGVIRAVVPEVPSSCGQGTCGVCETRVLAGEIEHRDGVLSQSERDRGDTMMVCVSRSKGGELVLDL